MSEENCILHCLQCHKLKSDDCSDICCYLREFREYHSLSSKVTKLDMLNMAFKTNNTESVKSLMEEVTKNNLSPSLVRRNFVSLGDGTVGVKLKMLKSGELSVFFYKLKKQYAAGEKYGDEDIDHTNEPLVIELKNIGAVVSLERIAAHARAILEVKPEDKENENIQNN